MNGKDIKILLSVWATILIMGEVLWLWLKLANQELGALTHEQSGSNVRPMGLEISIEYCSM